RKDKRSIFYIAFGSHPEISNQLMKEIGHGLFKYGRQFLWVIREGQDRDKMEDKLSCKDKLENQGKINGIRVNTSEGVVETDVFNRCITIAMGSNEEGEELRRNANKWSDFK
uniref:Uncharacterized protein n=1 Tax=Solanum lycopersicum TaxID=4081 RepID=A0A3Q7GF64_SOLLC